VGTNTRRTRHKIILPWGSVENEKKGGPNGSGKRNIVMDLKKSHQGGGGGSRGRCQNGEVYKVDQKRKSEKDRTSGKNSILTKREKKSSKGEGGVSTSVYEKWGGRRLKRHRGEYTSELRTTIWQKKKKSTGGQKKRKMTPMNWVLVGKKKVDRG